VTWVVPLALGGVAILVMAVFTMLSARKRHRAIVAPATAAGPRILVHDINDDRCTGCDACVAVCPTNVLDLVANKSRVLRFHDCIQCEACMFACPTEALVMFPEGSVPPALKVPEIDENFQTAIPGQYLIGEVAGKPLVKNAANLGRAVVEHMLATGLQPGALGGGETNVDVAIVGSGPGGLSAALTCIQKGLSYVVLEKEQMIASTIARYPKGKLVMAEPYDTVNLSLLPVFDSGKEQLIPIWSEVIERVGLQIKQGESVETVARGPDGVFDVRSTVAAYRAQRVVLSIGTRGKPRTLQVPGENLPKVYSLLEDPDEWRGRSVLVVGGGDSACEAALALADAGAKVMISYRGKGFNRAAPKNKSAIEGYASQGRIKAKLGSQVLNFEADSVTLALADGAQKRYPNDGTFVLIGADPPVAWLEKMGVRFVERPHQYQLGKTDDIVRKFVARAIECPEDGARAAAQVLGGSVGIEPPRVSAAMQAASPSMSLSLPMPMGEPVSGPRKWLRSATSIFSNRSNSGMMAMPEPPAGRTDGRRSKKFDAPVPLSEFAKRGKSGSQSHSGHGRRDALSAGERTRILRMLRDEGGRLADEDEQVYAGGAQRARDYDFDFEDDSPAPAPTNPRPDVPAKPAVVVGIAQAQAARTHSKRANAAVAHPRPAAQPAQAPLTLPPQDLSAPSQEPPPSQAPRSRQFDVPPTPSRSRQVDVPPEPPRSRQFDVPPTPSRSRQVDVPPEPPRSRQFDVPPTPSRSRQVDVPPEPPQFSVPPTPSRSRQVDVPPEPPQSRQFSVPPTPSRSRQVPVPTPPPRRSVPVPFGDEPTRQVDDDLLTALRNSVPAKPSPRVTTSKPSLPRPTASRPALPRPGGVRPAGHDEPTRLAHIGSLLPDAQGVDHGADDLTRPSDDFPPRFLAQPTDPDAGSHDDHRGLDDSTRLASMDSIAALERARNHGTSNDERTRAVNIRNDPSISDIDWDLD
jgi:thioredoxin reductase/ferredoxin